MELRGGEGVLFTMYVCMSLEWDNVFVLLYY